MGEQGPERRFLYVFALLGMLSPTYGAGCAAQQIPEPEPAPRHSRTAVETAAKPPSHAGLVIGTFRLPAGAVADGDTLEVVGLDESLRLLGIDTEETFKSKADRRAANLNFGKYLRQNRGQSERPRKAATPMGEAAKAFAKTFFKDVSEVRLERDHPKEIKGGYGRYLAYVFAKKNGRWVNYNIECVRAGMSPYFMKYGYSRRFHHDFIAAEEEARAQDRGIWSPRTQNYGDYAERKLWWTARADFIEIFRNDPGALFLGQWDVLDKIQASVGKEVVVVATAEAVQHLGTVRRVMLSRTRWRGFPIIFFDDETYETSGIGTHVGEFVAVRGKVEEYRKNGRRDLQIVVRDPEQVVLSRLPNPSWHLGTVKE